MNYAEPGDRAYNVELIRCDDDIILTVRAAFDQTDRFGRPFGDECVTTSTFAEFCEATVRCRFTQAEFRAAIGDLCSADYDQARITFAYECLPGKRPLTCSSSVEISAFGVFLRLLNSHYNTREILLLFRF